MRFPTLYLTPIGLNRDCWRGLQTGDDDILLEYPGHGVGPHAMRPPFPDLFALVDRVAEHIPSGGVHVVGQSMGGIVALQLAVRHPELVHSLCVAACPADCPPEEMAARAARTRALGMGGVLEETLGRWFGPSWRSEDSGGVRYARSALLDLDPEVFAAGWLACGQHDLRGRLDAIRAPTTIIAGRSDRSVSLEKSVALFDEIGRARLELVPSGHVPSVERPDETARALRLHRAWVDAGAAGWMNRRPN